MQRWVLWWGAQSLIFFMPRFLGGCSEIAANPMGENGETKPSTSRRRHAAKHAGRAILFPDSVNGNCHRALQAYDEHVVKYREEGMTY